LTLVPEIKNVEKSAFMRSGFRRAWRLAACGMVLFAGANASFAQVSPAEIANPRLKALEQKYLSQMVALNRAIGGTKFPFPFQLSRYAGLSAGEQAVADTRGLEFVNFHERIVLKISGNYNAAYNAGLLTQNQRADRVFHEVIVPILRFVSKEISADVDCDEIGLEISYHVRRQTRNTDFEGKEILVVLLARSDAFVDAGSLQDGDWQEILNRSEVYLNGGAFGLALRERQPLDPEALGRPAQPESAGGEAPGSDTRLGRIQREAWPGLAKPESQPARPATPAPAGLNPTADGAAAGAQSAAPPPATQADPQRLQAKYQAQLDALAKEGQAKFHFVEYSPPSFAIFQNRVILQLTLRNPRRFETNAGSIYKRAAQSFDLFLAPQLKDLLEKIPIGADFEALDITVLNELDPKSAVGSEALEFVCPLKGLRQFANAEITNQELINQSMVLVNGVRIALNLQLVE